MVNICDMIAYEMCVLFFKMAAHPRRWGENYVDELCKISSNTPPLTSDEEHALEEELANANANANAPTHLDDDSCTPNFESFPQTVEDAEVGEAT
ncbi:hypothetical protein SO802_026394 [Lithocarpus litseifolius]|uniref:Uncharacterized protein n=1 Tax=Lithocarpus litseifolius TaxID=425828 RepID=A0AAW2C2S3_9ROSI